MDSDVDIEVFSTDSVAKPSKYPFLSELRLDLDVTRRLSSLLDRIRFGDSAIITSALGKDNDPQSVLASWDEIFKSKSDLMNSPLIDIELNNRGKFGPRSIAKPFEARKDGLRNHYSDKQAKLPFDIYSGLKEPVKGRLRPLDLSKAVKLLKNNTNSGLPYFTKKGKIKDRLSKRMEFLLNRKDPCILFTRTQEGGKTRNVWGFPVADTLEEMRYYAPLLDFQRKLSWRSALRGPEDVDKAVTDLLLRAKALNRSIISGDVSAFDENIVLELVRASFYYISVLFQSDFRAGLDRISERFSSIGIVTPDGIATGYHGVPSGSTFTNEVDSIIQYLICMSTGFIRAEDLQIQGDDLLVAIDDNNIPELFKKYNLSYIPLSDEKSDVSKEYCIFLQCLYHLDYLNNGIVGGIYPTYRALNRILYQERWSDFEDYDLSGIDYYSIRTISILEN